ncbi:MAG TPA: 3'-5' exonuclease [Phycisphaerae bacterium]|nr:3'-5' exonuclease [Phycisphaerae bacterium]
MGILFFDTETTDLPDYRSAPGEHQPHVVQLAAVLDQGGSERVLTTLIRPEGWSISPDAQRVHGISTEQATAEGIPIAEAMAEFDEMLDQATVAVAHNVRFDRLLIDSEHVRLRRKARWPRTVCTMLTCTDIVRVIGHWGGYKWPTLEETYRHFFGQPPTNAHDALSDVRACQRIYHELIRQGHVRQS